MNKDKYLDLSFIFDPWDNHFYKMCRDRVMQSLRKFSGYIQKNRDLDVFPVSLCLTVSTTAVGPWFRVRPIASDPVGHNSRAPVAVYVFV